MMGLLYPWATKEYLLWNMTLGQIILYHNTGIELKYGKEKDEPEATGLADMTADELREFRDSVMPKENPDATREQLREKYGDIG